jgi:hypothetical protein
MDFEIAWPLGLSFGVASSLAAFFTGHRASSFPARRRRLLFAAAALLSFGTAFPVGFTALFFFVFGASGYCEDAGGPCAPSWWVLVGLSLFIVVGGLSYLVARAVKEYRRTL